MSNARGSGSASGTLTTPNDASNPSLRDATLDSGSGSGSDGGSASGRCNMGTTVEFGDTGYISTPEEVTCDPPTVQVPIIVGYPGTCPVSVNYATQNGTAIAGTDYTAVSGTATIPAGSSGPYLVNIPILDDGTDESVGSEVFYVNLSSPQNATIGGDNPFRVYISEPTLQGSTDTLVWNPCQDGDSDDNYNASNPLNWYDQTLGRQLQKGEPGPGSGTPIIFDGTPTTQTPDDDSPITWDDPKDPSWTLQNFTKQETIKPGDTIELTGAGGTALTMDASSSLNLTFASSTSKFQIDANATITNMNLGGIPGALFEIAGGTTTMAGQAGLTETLGVQFTIDPGATVRYENYNPLQLTANSLVITVYGKLNTYWGQNNQNTMISGGAAAPKDYIDVSGGTMIYAGRGNIADTITVPIAVHGGGTLQVTIDPTEGKPAGNLIVQGGNASTNNVAVYLAGGLSKRLLKNAIPFITYGCSEI